MACRIDRKMAKTILLNLRNVEMVTFDDESFDVELTLTSGQIITNKHPELKDAERTYDSIKSSFDKYLENKSL